MSENAGDLSQQLSISAMKFVIRELKKEDQNPQMIQALASLINVLRQC